MMVDEHRCLEHSAIVARIDGLKEAVEVARSSLDSRLEETKTALEHRFESVNEARGQLKDQAARFITRDELSAIINRLGDDVRELRTFKDRMSGMATQKSLSFVQLIAILGLVVSLVGLFLRR